jgi:hypothetical protein
MAGAGIEEPGERASTEDDSAIERDERPDLLGSPLRELAEFVDGCVTAMDLVTSVLPSQGVPEHRCQLATDAWGLARERAVNSSRQLAEGHEPGFFDLSDSGLTGPALDLKLEGASDALAELLTWPTGGPVDDGIFLKSVRKFIRWAMPTLGSLITALRNNELIADALEMLGEAMELIGNLLEDAEEPPPGLVPALPWRRPGVAPVYGGEQSRWRRVSTTPS